MSIWIVYRKGSFYLKEQVQSEALAETRKAALVRQGASFVGIVRGSENNPWLSRAIELPGAAIR